AAMEESLMSGSARELIADIDWPTLRAAMEATGEQPFLAEIDAPGIAHQPSRSAAPQELRESVAHASDRAAKEERIDEYVRKELARCLGVEPAAIDPERGLFEMGLDSLMAVEFRRAMSAATGLDLPNTLIFNYPNVACLTKHLCGQLVVPEGLAIPTAKPDYA